MKKAGNRKGLIVVAVLVLFVCWYFRPQYVASGAALEGMTLNYTSIRDGIFTEYFYDYNDMYHVTRTGENGEKTEVSVGELSKGQVDEIMALFESYSYRRHFDSYSGKFDSAYGEYEYVSLNIHYADGGYDGVFLQSEGSMNVHPSEDILSILTGNSPSFYMKDAEAVVAGIADILDL